MTDLSAAIAASREADKLRFKTGMTAAEAIRIGLDKEKALRDLLAALDAAQSEAVLYGRIDSDSGEIAMKNGVYQVAEFFSSEFPVGLYLAPPAALDAAALAKRLDKMLGTHADSMPKEAYAEVDAVMRALKQAPPAALAVLQDLSERFSAMHANGDVWITSVAAAKMAQAAATQAPPAAAVPEEGLRDSVLNSAKFRASCYALVGIVEGIAGLGRRWASDGERLKDTPEWVAFYNSVAAMRNGTAEPTSAKQAPPAAAVASSPLYDSMPERIWLQIDSLSEDGKCDEPFNGDLSDLTWCADSVGGEEVMYVRADLAQPSANKGNNNG